MNTTKLKQGYEHIKQIIDTCIEADNIKFTTSEISPNNYKDMKRYYETFNSFLVYGGGDHGHLGKQYNIKFRALHDYMHWYHDRTFSFEDEKILSSYTVVDFVAIARYDMLLSDTECDIIGKIIDAEIRGQIEYYETNNKFVDDQKQFINDYLKVG